VRTFHLISPMLHMDPKVRQWPDATFRLAVYLLTCRHRNTEGLYWLPPAYMAIDLGWTEEKVGRCLNELIEDEFVSYDAEAEVVFIRKALKYQPPTSPQQIKGAIRKLAEVPPHALAEEFVLAAQEYAPNFHAALVNGSPD
jgi:hypothetical protein